jgi:uncharacterized damage-inducible protein DinB
VSTTVSAPAPAASAPSAPASFITPDGLLQHWQGHRRLTRRLIEAYPEDQLQTFAIGGMRPFGALAWELVTMAEPTVRGLVTGEWGEGEWTKPTPSREEILRRWDESTAQLDALFPQIPPQRFHEVVTAFGQWTMPANALLLYLIDNEIHHRGQGYVYLRALGVEPPHFWER